MSTNLPQSQGLSAECEHDDLGTLWMRADADGLHAAAEFFQAFRSAPAPAPARRPLEAWEASAGGSQVMMAAGRQSQA